MKIWSVGDAQRLPTAPQMRIGQMARTNFTVFYEYVTHKISPSWHPMKLVFVFVCLSDLQQSWTSLTSVQFSSPPPGNALCGDFFCVRVFFTFSGVNSHISRVRSRDKNSVKYWHLNFEDEEQRGLDAIIWSHIFSNQSFPNNTLYFFYILVAQNHLHQLIRACRPLCFGWQLEAIKCCFSPDTSKRRLFLIFSIKSEEWDVSTQ